MKTKEKWFEREVKTSIENIKPYGNYTGEEHLKHPMCCNCVGTPHRQLCFPKENCDQCWRDYVGLPRPKYGSDLSAYLRRTLD